MCEFGCQTRAFVDQKPPEPSGPTDDTGTPIGARVWRGCACQAYVNQLQMGMSVAA